MVANKLYNSRICTSVVLSFLFLALASRPSSGADTKAQANRDARVSIEPRAKPGADKETVLEHRAGSIRIDSTLVQINVTVTDPLNRFVTGLDKEYFKLFEDKIEQEVRQFSSEDAPLSIGLVFDTS